MDRLELIKKNTVLYNPDVEFFSANAFYPTPSGDAPSPFYPTPSGSAPSSGSGGNTELIQMGTDAALTLLSGILSKAPNEYKGKVKAACGGKPLVGKEAKERWRKCATNILTPILPPPQAERKTDTGTVLIIAVSALLVTGIIVGGVIYSKKSAAAVIAPQVQR